MKILFFQICLYEGLIIDQQQKTVDVDEVDEHACRRALEMFIDDEEAIDCYLEQGLIDTSSNCFRWKGVENMIIMSWNFQ